jgi:hypothetical protein
MASFVFSRQKTQRHARGSIVTNADVHLPEQGAPQQPLAAPTGPTSYYDLLKVIASNTNQSAEEKLKLIKELKGVSPTSDRLTYRSAIFLLGLIALATIVIVAVLVFNGKGTLDGLIAIASAAVGGLAGLLSPSRGPDPHTP